MLVSILFALLVHTFFLPHQSVIETRFEPQAEIRETKPQIPSTNGAVVSDARKHPRASIPIRIVISCAAKTWLEAAIDNEKPFEVTSFREMKCAGKGKRRSN